MQMNLNMWEKGIKETISNHDKHETVSWLFKHAKKTNQLEKKIEKHSEIRFPHIVLLKPVV